MSLDPKLFTDTGKLLMYDSDALTVCLPCAHKLCSNCLKSFSVDKKITCSVCSQTFSDEDYPIDDLLIEILNLNPVEINRGKKIQELLSSTRRLLEKSNEHVAHINSFILSAESIIKNYFHMLKSRACRILDDKMHQLSEHKSLIIEKLNQ
jgi:hypothetical protein